MGELDKRNWDAWENVLTGHGTSRDKRTSSRIGAVRQTVDRQTLEDIFAGDDIAARMALKPASDMTRAGWTLEIGDDLEARDAVLSKLGELGAAKHLKEGLTWATVYGGGMIFVGADDRAGDSVDALAEPLDMGRLQSVEYLETYDRFELDIHSEYTAEDVASGSASVGKVGKPKAYRLRSQTSPRGQATTQDLVIHESRWIRLDGPITPRERKRRNDGWNDSAYTRIEQVLADFGIGWGGAAHLLADWAVGVFKMQGLAEAIASDSSGLVLDRIGIMDMCKSTVRMLPLDETEEYQRMQTPVQGMSDLLDRFMIRMAAAADMPVTVLFGRSPAGMNATGESDIRIWYDQVASRQEAELRSPLERLVELITASAEGPTGGQVPDEIALAFNPLWQPTQKETTETRKIQADADAVYIDTGVASPDEIARSRFGGEEYSYETTIDLDAEPAPAAEPEPEPEA